MKKTIFLAALCMAALLAFPAGERALAAEKLSDFSDDFEQYAVDGKFIEENAVLTKKWDNNVFRGGDALGMDSHIYQVGKIEYENGTDGNKVLHLNNTEGANTFFYMGPSGDYRVKDFTVSFRIKFLAEGISQHSWAGISFRKKANAHYTGTNNLMFVLQRSIDSGGVAGNAYAVFNGGSEVNLDLARDLYGEKLSLVQAAYNVPQGEANKDLPWIEYRLTVKGNRYLLAADGTTVADCTFDIANYDYFGYLSLNCCTSNILVDDFSVTVQDETMPPEILPLSTPVVKLDAANKKIAWDAVEGAGLYLVKIGDTEKTVNATEYSLDRLKAGSYTITVTALSDDTFLNKNSAPSEPISYTVSEEETPGQSGGTEQEPESGCGAVATFGTLAAAILLGGAVLCLRRRK